MKLIILDRDGVINHDSDAYIKSPDEWRPIAGSLEAIARLNKAGYRVAVATNQSGVGRGLFDLATLGAIHAKMQHLVAEAGGRIDAVFFCPHGPDAQCACRKPAPGLMHEILKRFDIEPGQVITVGDSLRDLQAAQAAGCAAILVRTGKGAKAEKAGGLPAGVRVMADLAAVAADLAP